MTVTKWLLWFFLLKGCKMPVARSLELPIHFVALNGDPHKGITVNMTWPFTVTFLTLKHMEKRNQTNCVFLPFDHRHLCIEPPLVTRASGVDMASRHKETCHGCSMTPQYHTFAAKAPTWPPTKVRDCADLPSIIWVGSSCFESYSNRLHAAVWWKVCLTRCFRLESDPKIEWYRLDLVDYIWHWLSSGTQDEVNTENLGKSMFQLKN